MKGDFTRFTFRPAKHYDAVLTQQGRVQTDADWNEQVMIAAHRNRIQLLDLIGPTGAPEDLLAGGRGSFLVSYEPDGNNVGQIYINHGRYYLDGLMVESEAPVRYRDQPGARLPQTWGGGTYLVYLDVWRRHITSLEDPDIREVALAGADSGSRSQLVWQVRMERVAGLDVDVNDIPVSNYGPTWQPVGRASTGAMDVRAGSTPLENQLYRVEIHRGNTPGTSASFKWSRDNGTVVARVRTHSPPTEVTVVRDGAEVKLLQFSITVDQTGRDSFSSFLPDHMVELSSEEFVLMRKPGIFARVTTVVGDTLNLEVPYAGYLLSPSVMYNPLAGTIPTVRRWDNSWNPDLQSVTLTNVGAGYTLGNRILLERDITVAFGVGQTNHYQTGDYWLIPARTISGLEGWIRDQPQPPAGEQHSYAPLALVKVQPNGTVANPTTDLLDIREVFPTLRSTLDLKVGKVVQGSGDKDYLPKWKEDGSALVNSSIKDDGNAVAIGGTLKVSADAASAAIKRFTGGSISSESEPAQVVPTTGAVKTYVEQVVNGTAGKLAKLTGAHAVGNSIVSESGAALTVDGTLKVSTDPGSVAVKRFTGKAIHDADYSDKAEVVPTTEAVKAYVDRSVPPGTVIAYASETVPDGWKECNGDSLTGAPGTTFGKLFAAIGKAFGDGNGSQYGFNLPNLKGRFIRGWSHGSANDPDRGSRTASDGGGATGDHVGSYQGDLNKEHFHAFSATGTAARREQEHSHGMKAYDDFFDTAYDIFDDDDEHWFKYSVNTLVGQNRYLKLYHRHYTDDKDTSHSHNVSIPSHDTGNSGGSETRPKNVYLMYIIKY
jgi:microcystin-dependent protein